MHVAPRSYLTAGIAVLGAGAIAVAPVQPIPTQVALDSHRVVSDLGIDLLASSIDPITPWVTTFETAAANIGTLVEFYLQKPFPLLQTIGANIATYIEEIGNGQGALIPEQIWGNIVTFFEAPWDPGDVFPLTAPPAVTTPADLPKGDYLSETRPADGTNSPEVLNNGLIFLFFSESVDSKACYEGGDCQFVQAAPILQFLNNNFSGQLLGLLGTVISPLVALTKSFTAIGEFFEAGDVIGAINELINIPANMTNAFLNGAGYLDLTEIVKSFVDLPVDEIGLNLGGLLTPTPRNGSLADPEDPPTEWTGGTGFDGLAIKALADGSGIPVGWTGSVIGLGQFLAEQLLVTPPAPPPVAAAQASTPVAPVDVPAAPALVDDAPPAVVELPEPVAEYAPAVVEEAAEVDAAEAEAAVAEIEVAEIEAAVAEVEAEVAEAEAPAVAEDNAPAAATGSDDSAETGTRATDSRRGAASDD